MVFDDAEALRVKDHGVKSYHKHQINNTHNISSCVLHQTCKTCAIFHLHTTNYQRMVSQDIYIVSLKYENGKETCHIEVLDWSKHMLY